MARIRHTRSLYKTYAIIGEGISEFFYFDQFREYEKELLYEKRIAIKPDKPKHADFRDILSKAESYLAKEYDEIFCLIDLDYIFHEPGCLPLYSKMKRNCERKYKNRIHFIESNPAFEFWLLIHFTDSSRYLPTCNEVIFELRKKGRLENYKKTEKFYTSNNIYAALHDKLDVAIQNGHRLLKNTVDDPQCSHSRVFEIFNRLLKAHEGGEGTLSPDRKIIPPSHN